MSVDKPAEDYRQLEQLHRDYMQNEADIRRKIIELERALVVLRVNYVRRCLEIDPTMEFPKED